MNTTALGHAVDFVRSWLPLRYESGTVPGFAVAIACEGQILLNEAYGYADLERSLPLSTDHIVRIASHSKTFTATALMLLQEEGRLRIADRVVDHLPWLQEHRDPRWRDVTLELLLSHGAGVIRDGEDADYWHLEHPFPDAAQLREEILACDLVLAPATQMKYSNYGYSLLGMVVEAVSATPYNTFVTERIVRPLALASTHPEYGPALEGRLVTGYGRRENGRRLPIAQVNTRAMSAATGFCSTTADLCAYFTAHMVGSGQLLSDASKREMQRVHWHAKSLDAKEHQDYGLGFFLDDVGGRRLFGHSGGFPGAITRTMADPAERLVVTALTNSVDGPAATIVDGIYKILSYFEEHTPEGSDVAAPDLRRLEGLYANLWGVTGVVALGERLVTVAADSWDPMAAVESLERLDETTFRITDTASGGSPGELVRFVLRDGAVESVRFAGTTSVPRPAWLARQEGRTIVGA